MALAALCQRYASLPHPLCRCRCPRMGDCDSTVGLSRIAGASAHGITFRLSINVYSRGECGLVCVCDTIWLQRGCELSGDDVLRVCVRLGGQASEGVGGGFDDRLRLRDRRPCCLARWEHGGTVQAQHSTGRTA